MIKKSDCKFIYLVINISFVLISRFILLCGAKMDLSVERVFTSGESKHHDIQINLQRPYKYLLQY